MVIDFSNLVEVLLILRLCIVFYGATRIFYILYSKENIEFFKKYNSFIDLKKISTLIISVLSLVCFEYIIFSFDSISLENAFELHFTLSIIIFIALISVLIYSFIDTKKSIKECHLFKKKIRKVILAETIANGVENISSKSNHFFAKIINIGSKISKKVIENKIESEVKKKTHSIMISVLFMMFINTLIILASYYVMKT